MASASNFFDDENEKMRLSKIHFHGEDMETKTFSQLFATPKKDHCLGRMLCLSNDLLQEGNRHKHIAMAALSIGAADLGFYDRQKAVLQAGGLALGKPNLFPTPNGEVMLATLPAVRPGEQNCTARLEKLVAQLVTEGFSDIQLTDACVELALHHADLSPPDSLFYNTFRMLTTYDVDVVSPLPGHNGKVSMAHGPKN